jgi:hypothetical protein
MRAREYLIVVEPAGGAPARELCRTATTGHPALGDEIVVDHRSYTVSRVRHEDDLEAPGDDRVYTVTRVFVRPRPGGDARRPGDPAVATEPGPRVLTFRAPAADGDGALTCALLPAPLVAVLVAAGYREQASRHRVARRVMASLRRAGHGWFVDGGEDHRQLSRRAKRHFAEVAALIARWPLDGRARPSVPPRRLAGCGHAAVAWRAGIRQRPPRCSAVPGPGRYAVIGPTSGCGASGASPVRPLPALPATTAARAPRPAWRSA